MKTLMTMIVVSSFLMLVPPVHAQQDITLDLSAGSADTQKVCPVDVADRTIYIPDVNVPERWIVVEDVDYTVSDGEIFIPGLIVERGGQPIVNIPPTIIPYDGHTVHVEGASRSIGPFFVPTPDPFVEGVAVCLVLPA